ncbi:hypothetical protein DPMN_076087 [Dreissena polymorpha]|uniref:Uncharacterized protein n=1 Tax=Dreissena polymorpha TaxID=45954 RepID=A0A9D4BN42_DREPO|nr:hypothetical protein DPMN_076087 [Dreissena polymorpha]
MNVLTCNDTTLASSGLPTRAEGRASGKKELIFQVLTEIQSVRFKKKLVITNEGFRVYAKETVCDSVTGEWSAYLRDMWTNGKSL